MTKKLLKLSVNNRDSIEEQFYNSYNPDYWAYKISLLKNSHDDFDNLKNYLKKNLISEVDDEEYKKMIRTELHFLYFHMIETLFEIIFAIAEHDNRYLWVDLSFSGNRQTKFYSDCYKKISDFNENKLKKPDLNLELLEWIFYFKYKIEGDIDNKKNLSNISHLLKIFAEDFTDHDEYNSYKHASRFYNSAFKLSMGLNESNMMDIGQSNDCISYLDIENKKNNHASIVLVKKPFDFERDYLCCGIIQALISNILNTRKHTFLSGNLSEKINLSIFDDLNVPEDLKPNTGIKRSSFSL